MKLSSRKLQKSQPHPRLRQYQQPRLQRFQHLPHPTSPIPLAPTTPVPTPAKPPIIPVTDTTNPPAETSRFVKGRERMQHVLEDVRASHSIISGQGEYVAYHVKGDQRLAVSLETYEKVYEIFAKHLPHFSKSSHLEEGSKRYESLRTKIKEIDPSLEITFIPRTLYELIYMQGCIEEDLTHKAICPRIDYQYLKVRTSMKTGGAKVKFEKECEERKKKIKTFFEKQSSKTCWHKTHFLDTEGDSQQRNVKKIAYRLNNVILTSLPSSNPLTYSEMEELTNKTLVLFKEIAPGSTNDRHARGISKRHLELGGAFGGPTAAFSLEKGDLEPIQQPKLFPLGLRKEGVEEKIIKNSIALECSHVAQNSFLLYRGGKIVKDKPFTDKQEPYSISLGTSLYAGSIYDQGATAAHFMRENMRDAFAISVPFKQVENGIFQIPRAHAICQITAKGEFFHGRSKTPAGLNPEDKVYGISGTSHVAYKDLPESFKSDIEKTKYEELFEEYMDGAFVLK